MEKVGVISEPYKYLGKYLVLNIPDFETFLLFAPLDALSVFGKTGATSSLVVLVRFEVSSIDPK